MGHVLPYEGKHLECPLCRAPLGQQGSSVLCAAGHNFDIAKKGYVNFNPVQRPSKYTKELFVHRQFVFEQGFYQPAADAIMEEIAAYTQGKANMLILDAGCGEGYYAGAASNAFPEASLYAVDISKQAVMMGAGRDKRSLFMVADLAQLPLEDACVDVLLNILSPANYQEFSRVMKKDAVLIKVIPEREYLCEIREQVQGSLRNRAYSNEQVLSLLQKQMNVLHTRRITYKKACNSQQSEALFAMTPLTLGVDSGVLQKSAITEITIDLLLVACSTRG
ncbi:methyltransferase domain-containing protein [Clostridia bacterium OttesenSCG-928-F22]|nr:methyltransferase domain-containing protein [Clostridia bacterium OttesenSCG-928-F22]